MRVFGRHFKKHLRNRKHIPYGNKLGWYYCNECDAFLINPINKGSERQKAKKEIRKELSQIMICNYVKKL